MYIVINLKIGPVRAGTQRPSKVVHVQSGADARAAEATVSGTERALEVGRMIFVVPVPCHCLWHWQLSFNFIFHNVFIQPCFLIQFP
jgi:hypothetical protein